MLMTRPPRIPYPGGKGKLAPTLVDMMPRTGRYYVEPVVGRGNVFWAAALELNFERWWLNDTSTAPFFRAIRKTQGRIVVPERNREECSKYKSLYQQGDPRAVILEPYFTRNGGGYKNGGLAGGHSVGANGYRRTIACCAQILKTTAAEITMLDWHCLDWSSLGPKDFVFFDPPYFDADVRAYSNDFDHPGMVKLLKRAKFRWMLTEYEQPFYMEAFGEPHRIEVQCSCDHINTSRRVECVWKNY